MRSDPLRLVGVAIDRVARELDEIDFLLRQLEAPGGDARDVEQHLDQAGEPARAS